MQALKHNNIDSFKDLVIVTNSIKFEDRILNNLKIVYCYGSFNSTNDTRFSQVRQIQWMEFPTLAKGDAFSPNYTENGLCFDQFLSRGKGK